MNPVACGVFDNYCAKRSWLNLAPTLAQQLLLVDEVNIYFYPSRS